MRAIKHPLSGATYDVTDDGTITVVSRHGVTGTFDRRGRWLAGELRQADPHLCLWVGGRELPSRVRRAAEAVKSDTADNPATVPAEELTQ